MTHRPLLPGVLLGCALLAGCVGRNTDGAAAGSPPPVGTSSPHASPTVPGAAHGGGSGASGEPASTPSHGAGTASASPASPATGHRCHTSELKASLGPDRPGAGQSNFALVLTNASRRPCTIHGFPGVAFVNGEGEAVTPDPERAAGEERQIVMLAPGASAWSALTYANPALTGVTTVTPEALRVTPSDETEWISVPWTGGRVSNTGKASVPRMSPFRGGDGA
ncbi:DUF4232 domain-containing protein [Streptomyces stackebrandtii]|uniref:DUF4232 domain-containing protein n=1 Tax=Streptomyces stackebrandtii TaxID=3051177 RepID=UPI0028DB2EBE|nr:DUF4232 domain-containing protein [Streptomyces sp. DSM 40976]